MQLYGKPPQLLEHHPIEPQSTGAITKHQPDRAQPASIAYSGWGFWCNIWNTTPSNRRAAEPARVVYRVNVLDHFLMAALSPPHRTPSSVWLYNFSECPAVFFYGLDKKKIDPRRTWGSKTTRRKPTPTLRCVQTARLGSIQWGPPYPLAGPIHRTMEPVLCGPVSSAQSPPPDHFLFRPG